jgi:glycosyltransferase involved in cell wall biosynthesis
MRAIRLSYVLTTFNKLSYLKEILEDLINNCKEDEEIVISDGASSDGTITFLESLLRDGKIHQFVSEKDFGEAHGFNKAILLANGELIKLISDDDIFF